MCPLLLLSSLKSVKNALVSWSFLHTQVRSFITEVQDTKPEDVGLILVHHYLTEVPGAKQLATETHSAY